MAEVAQEHFRHWVRYHAAFDRYLLLIRGNRNWQMDVYVYWGPPATGKSRFAADHYPGAFWMPPNSQWFDGYSGQDTIIIDDYYGWLPWSFLLRLLDRYPLPLPVKGGHVPMQAKTIVFTSNQHPDSWYKYEQNPHMNYEALRRRILDIIEFRACSPYPS